MIRKLNRAFGTADGSDNSRPGFVPIPDRLGAYLVRKQGVLGKIVA